MALVSTPRSMCSLTGLSILNHFLLRMSNDELSLVQLVNVAGQSTLWRSTAPNVLNYDYGIDFYYLPEPSRFCLNTGLPLSEGTTIALS